MHCGKPRGIDRAAQDLQGLARMYGTPAGFPAYSPGLARQPGPFGAGAGSGRTRSVRGLPILWEPPSLDELRGQQWMQSPQAIRGRAAPGKRKGSQLADESLTKSQEEA